MAEIQIDFPNVHSWTRPRTTKNGGYYSPHRKALAEAKMIARVKCSQLLHKCDDEDEWIVTVGAYLPNRRPKDVDRIASFYLDALEGAVYKDDRQVMSLHVFKMINTPNNAGVVVRCMRNPVCVNVQ